MNEVNNQLGFILLYIRDIIIKVENILSYPLWIQLSVSGLQIYCAFVIGNYISV